MAWSPDSWRRFEARQQPSYPDPAALEAAIAELRAYPPLVSRAESEALKSELAEAQAGRAFLLQGGDCAESFAEFSPENIAGSFALVGAMAERIAAASGLPVVRVGRIAGQFAKPRSDDPETRADTSLPAYRGDIVNALGFEESARRPDPERMFRAWSQSAATIAQLAALADGPAERVYTSHEALLLAYEEALIRSGPGGGAYASSGHFLWIGDRTRFPGSAHVEFARGLANPLGLKCGPSLDPDTLLRLLDLLDPGREPGRITLIARMGHDRVRETLPPLIRAVRREGRPVLWSSDPMHANTVRTASGRKTRPFEAVVSELEAFFAVTAAEGARAGGIHVEMTGRQVAECIGGSAGVAESDLAAGYQSQCDPRLNPAQALELAAAVSGFLRASAPGSKAA